MRKSLTLSLAAVALVSATSCNEQLDVIATTSTEATYQDKLVEFAANFEKEFGTPDPNHTWGWGMTPEMADAILGGTTRAGGSGDPYSQGGAINTNVNQWTENNANSLKNVIHVPGWPAEDGRYYVKTGNYTSDGGTYTRLSSEPTSYVGNAMGDVTEYEIQWVSAHVRNHPVDELKDKHQALIHMSEFFIQQVSTDYDYDSEGNIVTYGGSHNYKQYEMDKLDFQSLTGAWTHINNFNAYMNLAPQKHIGANVDRNIMYVMSSGTEDFQYHPSNSTKDWFRKFVLLEFSWTEPLNPDWSKVGSGAGQNSLEYYLDHPAELDREGKTFSRTGYYLCFDYQSEKQGEEWSYEGDDIYSNWILKLTPGRYKQNNRWPKRLMCEDLGNTFDFDYNDAVFDLIFQPNVNRSGYYDCVITVQAAGGTMPIWIGADPTTWSESAKSEIHNLLGGHESTEPVNVIKGGAKALAASYRVKELFSTEDSSVPTFGKDEHGNTVIVTYPQPSDKLLQQMAAAAFRLEIYIQTPNGMEKVSGEKIFKSLRNGTEPTYELGYNDGNVSTNAAPQLFNCSTDALWTYENGHIGQAYEHFVDWVHNEQCQYRLRWDENEYYARNTGENTGTVVLIQHDATDKENWLGSWDFGPKSSNVWGSAWIDKSKCWGGNGPE